MTPKGYSRLLDTANVTTRTPNDRSTQQEQNNPRTPILYSVGADLNLKPGNLRIAIELTLFAHPSGNLRTFNPQLNSKIVTYKVRTYKRKCLYY
ncbi:Hypothetical predicted protein [Pelobates cultripes]|uniref:Uncharacterized protein n=1 Tax=Pelobates cultripes TaxID=61616 RepID=A0AAD1RYM5_PELCU|nr:Hypothetical predicted protein [Pelobates cultripes]